MMELYWLTRVGELSSFFGIIFILVMVALGVMAMDCFFDGFEERYSKWIKRLILIMLISAIGMVFCPSKKDMLIIYGVGSTIEYLKDNDTAKKLPEKSMKCLEKLLDEYLTDDKKENK